MIDDKQGKKLAIELTNEHPLVVFGMAKSVFKLNFGSEITSLAVTNVKEDGCEIRVTLCRGDLCEVKESFYKFNQPLKSLAELHGRVLIDVHSRVCTPNPFWLVTDPLSLLILVVCSLLAYGTYVGVDDMTDALLQTTRLESTISAVFGTSRTFSYFVCGSFWFSVVAHAFEAAIALHHALISLKLGVAKAGLWGLMIFLVGYPMFSRLQKLVSVQQNHAKSK
eukprot:jgi/Psemu1/294118/fgenesh1_pm.8_\